MCGKLFSLAPRLLIVVLAVLLAIGLFAVSAQSGELATASAPAAGWLTLDVGERAWYAFCYPGDGTEIHIRMAVSPKDSARFSVWSEADALAWIDGGAEKPIGRGTANEAMGGDLNWAGRITIQGRYYVLVEQVGANAAGYQLDISGSSVSFPGVAPATATPTVTRAPTVTATPGPTPTVGPSNSFSYVRGEVIRSTVVVEATEEAVKEEPTATSEAEDDDATAEATPTTEENGEAEAAEGEYSEAAIDATPVATVELIAVVAPPPALPDAGTTPANALAIDGIPSSLAAGGRRWYAFSSSGDSEEIVLSMMVTPRDSARFSVWSANEAIAYASGRDVEPVGRGSVNNALGGVLTWAGRFSIRGTYYVLVEQVGDSASFYTLEIGGPGAQ